MNGEISVVENIIHAISILNKTDEYLDSLNDRLSECDSLNSDLEHLIEFTPIEKVNLKELYSVMQKIYLKRRKIKNDMTINKIYKNNISKLQESGNMEILVQYMKTTENKNDNLTYTNRILNDELLKKIIISEEQKRGRGRPKKTKEEG